VNFLGIHRDSWGFEQEESDHGIDGLLKAETDQTKVALALGHLEKRFLFRAEFIAEHLEFDAQSPAAAADQKIGAAFARSGRPVRVGILHVLELVTPQERPKLIVHLQFIALLTLVFGLGEGLPRFGSRPIGDHASLLIIQG
jgi:hypothetical protein